MKLSIILTIIIITPVSLFPCDLPPTTIASYPAGTYLVGEQVLFDASASHDNDNNPGTVTEFWVWNFNYSQGAVSGMIAPSPIVPHAFTQPGTYKVAVQYVNKHGLSGNICVLTIIIWEQKCKVVNTSYNHAGNIIKQEANHEMYYWYSYDCQGRLDTVFTSATNNKAAAHVDAVYNYDAEDKISSVQLPNATVNYSYTDRDWVSKITSPGLYTDSLGYLLNGNISTRTTAYNALPNWAVLSYNFEYDCKNQLIASVCSDNNISESYGYDGDGNILRKLRNGKSMRYNYISGTNKLSSVTVNNANKPFEYYSNGNLKTDGNKNISIADYDSRNLMLTNTNGFGDKSVYSYDDAGRRTAKVVNGHVEYYLADQTGRDLLIYNLDSNKVTTANIYGNGLIGAIDRGTRRYYIKDHLGTIRMTLDSVNTVISANDYYPFGEVIPTRSVNNSNNGKNYLFTEKERDLQTNYDYFGARYYDSELGRWTTQDPLKDKYPGWSSYNYCMNSPLKLVDPDGKQVGIPVYVGVETEGLGHAYTVCVDDKTGAITAWSYGRYDGTSSGGTLNPVGDGVLLKLQGVAAKTYVSKELQKEGGALYKIQSASTDGVNEHFQNMYDKSTQPSQRYSEDGKVIDTYVAPVNTCVTKTIEGVNAGGGTIPNATTVIPTPAGGVTVGVPPVTPQGLKDALNTVSEPKKEIPK